MEIAGFPSPGGPFDKRAGVLREVSSGAFPFLHEFAPATEAKRALQEREIAQATADFNCTAETGFWEVHNEEQMPYEHDSADRYADVLDRMRLKYATASQSGD